MDQNIMRCIQPATRWEDALPIGNGTLGALVYGNICHETIIFNHEACWFGEEKASPPNISGNLPELREMLENGQWAFADQFLNVMFLEKGYVPGQKNNYHPASQLKIDMVPRAPFTDYERMLDFSTGEARVTWFEGDVRFTRSCFVSRADDLICIRISNDIDDISCALRLQQQDLNEENSHAKGKLYKWSDIPIAFSKDVDNNEFQVIGTYEDGNQFGTLLRVIAEDGKLEESQGTLHISKAKEVLLLVDMFANKPEKDAIDLIRNKFDTLPTSYDALFESHVKLHNELYDRCSLDLAAQKEDRITPNEILLLTGYDGSISTALVERMYNFGRYLLISSSRPGGWPANLQGVWNGYYFPPWSSDYHNDENIQMNYWAALPGNLAETTMPYFDFYEACMSDYRKNAKAVYGARGLLAPIAQTIKGQAPLYAGEWLNWTAGAGWLAQLFHEYWKFTRDSSFLKERVVPYLKEIAFFYEDFLYEGKDGKLMFNPSLSPENKPDIPNASLVAINATMDVAIAKEVIHNLVDACKRLNIENENIPKWEKMLDKLPDYQVNEDGAMREWLYPGLKDNYHHRHVSHIYPLFPGNEFIQETNAELFEACKVAVEKRLVIGQESQSGWSLAHLASIWARLHDGNNALGCLEYLLRGCTGTNLLTYHNDWRHMGLSLYWDFIDKLFQIDANFGFTAAVLEMLVYSNEDMIKILPALPDKWKKGKLTGALTRCAVEVLIHWDVTTGKLRVELLPRVAGKVTVKFPGKLKTISSNLDVGNMIKSELGNEYKIFHTKKNEKIIIDCEIQF